MPSGNPYVGPRPFETGQQLFGRDREVAELRYLLISERIVLLYSPSGAGKSSLVNAGLIPEMAKRFDVWGSTRVNADPPDGVKNRYAWSAIAGLEKSEAHADMTLAEYAKQRKTKRNPLILFDQFEEILRVDPAGVAAKREFFRQAGELLADPSIWALFIIREDYLAPLDPYIKALPTHLQNRYRIDRLTKEVAEEAIANPLEGRGRSFAPGVVTTLAGNLATSKSDYVEPLQLQVVCYDLWERMEKAGKAVIEEGDLGDVSGALRNYYDNAVKVAGPAERAEREIREWFENQLITPDGVRNPVRGGLGDDVIKSLLDSWLVRSEPPWFELAHDRLVDPVRASNAAWFEEHLSKLQKVAKTWAKQDRPPGLLLPDAALEEAEQWARGQTSLTADEQKFLEASREAQKARDKERRQARRLRLLAIVSTVVSVLALVAVGIALWSYREANREMLIGTWQSAARQAANDVANNADDDRSALLARQAFLIHARTLGQPRYLVEDALQQTARRNMVAHVLSGHSPVHAVAFAPGGNRLATGGDDKIVRVWDLRQPSAAPLRLLGHAESVTSVAFSPDGNRLASASEDRSIRVWDVLQADAKPLVLTAYANSVFSVAFSPDGNRLAAAGENTVRVWDLRQPTAPPLALSGHKGPGVVYCVAWAPEGNRLASGGVGREVSVWDLRQPGAPPLILSGHSGSVNSVAFAPDGNRLASGSGRDVDVWDLRRPTDDPVVLSGDTDDVRSVAFAPDGNRLASGNGRDVDVWDLRRPTVDPVVLSGHTDDIRSVAFAPDGNRLASASVDGTVRVWELRLSGVPPRAIPWHTGVLSVAFDPEGARLATSSEDQTIEVWDLHHPAAQPLLLSGAGQSASVAFGPGNRVASAGNDQTVRVWNLSQPAAPPLLLRGHKGAVDSVAFAPDGNRLASAGEDQKVRVWDLRQPGAPPLILSGHKGSVNSVAFAPDGNRVASASLDKTVRVWDLRQPTVAPLVFSGHTEGVNTIAFAPDGFRLVSGSHDTTLRIWDIRRPTAPPLVLYGHTDGVISAAFAPDGARIASSGNDTSLRLWDLLQPSPVSLIIARDQGFGGAVAFAPNGSSLASVMGNHQLRIWPLWNEAADYLCTRVWRNLSMEEWKFYIGEGIPYESTCPKLPPGFGAPGGPK